jgi:hypothetical protein
MAKHSRSRSSRRERRWYKNVGDPLNKMRLPNNPNDVPLKK